MPEKTRTVWELSLMVMVAPGRQPAAGEQERGQALQVRGAEPERLVDTGSEALLDLAKGLFATHLAKLSGQVDMDALVAEYRAGVGPGQLLPACGFEPALLTKLAPGGLVRRLARVDQPGRDLDQALFRHRSGGTDQP